MVRTVYIRALAILGLLVVLGGLAAWYGSLGPAPGLGAYPSQEDLATDADRYLGTHVSVGGQVVTTDPVTIRAEYGAGETIRLTITDLAVTPAEGDHLRVYGVVEADRTIRAHNAFTVPQWGRWYTWSVSFLAGLWVLTRIIRYWRLDGTEWTLTPRDTPWTPRLLDRIRTSIHAIRD